MATSERSSKAYALLRNQAEERIKKWSNYQINENSDLRVLIEELKIHLAEQEIINEELRKAMDSMHGKKKIK